MKVTFTKTFERELRKVSEKKAKTDIASTIDDVKEAKDISGIKNLKKLKTYDIAYRIKVGQYRIGIFIENNEVEFHRIKKRKDIYRYFPVFILP